VFLCWFCLFLYFSIAVELQKMAAAARSGDRQGLLVSSRSCAAHLAGLHKLIQGLLPKVKDTKLQEKLFKASEGKNFVICFAAFSFVL
jgi:hypothetical protein